MSDDFDFLALGMSAIGIGVAVWAKRAAQRSASASEQSAIEAKKMRQLSTSDFLLGKFNTAEHIFHSIEHSSIKREALKPTEDARQALRELKELLGDDKDFATISDRLIEAEATVPVKQEQIMYGKQYVVPDDLPNLKRQFAEKRNKYLNIGQSS
jgi:hypothetical protein